MLWLPVLIVIQLIFDTETYVSQEDKDSILHSGSYAEAYNKFRTSFAVDEEDSKGLVIGSGFTTSAQEKKRRREFIKNVKMANKHNKIFTEGLSTYTLSVNEFSVMDDEERKMHTGLIVDNATDIVNKKLDAESRMIRAAGPQEFCWLTKGYVTNVKDQEKCASCWAFCSIPSIEYHYKRITGNLISLSDQEVLDCTREYGSGRSSCRGGMYNDAYSVLAKLQHLATERDYPYENREGRCRYKSKPNAVKGKLKFGKYSAVSSSVSAFEHAIRTKGPIAVSIATPQDFFTYNKGVYNGCRTGFHQLTHGVAIVGYAQSYFLVKNSWGPGWGDEGYVKMAKRNVCHLLSHGKYITANPVQGYTPTKEPGDETPPPPRCKDKEKESDEWHCEFFAMRGDCKTKRDFMAEYCADTCGFCVE